MSESLGLNPNVRRAVKSVLGLLLFSGIVWGLCEAAYVAFPYTRSGATVIHDAKIAMVRGAAHGPSLFAPGAKRKVLVLGTSKVLSGFVPALFDTLIGDHTSSFNAGLPGDERFMDNLDAALSAPDAPDVVLLTMPWSSTAPDGADEQHGGDGATMDTLFPFRHMPRDVALFLIRARSRGGVRTYYRDSGRGVAEMTAARGYYFIEGQSHFESNRLPDDFVLESDQPTVPLLRQGSADAAQFKRLCRLIAAHRVTVYYVPLYYRTHEWAPAVDNTPWKTALSACPNLTALGPEYWQFPNAQFADPVHLNPAGAEAYTRRLADLLRPALLEGRSARAF